MRYSRAVLQAQANNYVKNSKGERDSRKLEARSEESTLEIGDSKLLSRDRVPISLRSGRDLASVAKVPCSCQVIIESKEYKYKERVVNPLAIHEQAALVRELCSNLPGLGKGSTGEKAPSRSRLPQHFYAGVELELAPILDSRFNPFLLTMVSKTLEFDQKSNWSKVNGQRSKSTKVNSTVSAANSPS
ncbi:hypothetical protein L2E82_01789 [Cichorium intybus]|uniref:Uncharacterized protein n=1 Tax=Cichorium intybus TaxID=13427 RepID=A0ACB9H1D9_CICIN|nr:hypothetical protein L2E82_01789 [Cichorium intybus]